MVCEDITTYRMEHHHQSSSWMHDVSTSPPSLELVWCEHMPSHRHTRASAVYLERSATSRSGERALKTYLLAESGGSTYTRLTERSYGSKLWTIGGVAQCIGHEQRELARMSSPAAPTAANQHRAAL